MDRYTSILRLHYFLVQFFRECQDFPFPFRKQAFLLEPVKQLYDPLNILLSIVVVLSLWYHSTNEIITYLRNYG